MECRNCLLIAAAIIANFAAGASGACLGDSRIAEACRIATLKTLKALPHSLTASADGTERLPEHREPPAKHLTGALGNGDGQRKDSVWHSWCLWHVLSMDILNQLFKPADVSDDERTGVLGEDPGFGQERELSRNLLAIGTDPACDVRMPGRWIDPRTVVHDTGLACKAEDFGVNAILHS